MKREFLQGLGLEADVIKQIMAVHGSEINELTGKVTALEDDKVELERQVSQKTSSWRSLIAEKSRICNRKLKH